MFCICIWRIITKFYNVELLIEFNKAINIFDDLDPHYRNVIFEHSINAVINA